MNHDWLTHIKNSPVAHINQHLTQDEKKAKKSKYKNEPLMLDGFRFASKREARRYVELRMLANQGIISDLKLQVPYELNEGGSHSLKYIADFVYQKDGKLVVEDCKGYRTRDYKRKKKLMATVYGIEVIET